MELIALSVVCSIVLLTHIQSRSVGLSIVALNMILTNIILFR